jgi:DNA invertase Pin-like site-specific DNA recombinase
LLEILKPGSVILFSEISRIGRNTLQVLEFLKAATEKEITIHIAKQNMVIDNSMNSKIVVTVLAMVSEIEREFISTRTKEALAKLKAEGKTLGRPVGSKSVNKKLQENHNQLVGYLDKKISKTAIAKIFEVSRGTLDNYINTQIL